MSCSQATLLSARPENFAQPTSATCCAGSSPRTISSWRPSVPTHNSYDYAIVRVVPRVEREEFINAGVILSCQMLDFLGARIELDERRLLALDANVDLEEVRANLASIPLVCAGGAAAGAIG